MEKKFEIGDRVRMKRTVCFDYITFEKGCVGEISRGETNKGFCQIKMRNAENDRITEHFISASNLELIDTKTAFLSELKGLLEKYGADIWMDSYGFDANFLRIDLEGAKKQSFEVENGVINHDGEIKIKPLDPNWY